MSRKFLLLLIKIIVINYLKDNTNDNILSFKKMFVSSGLDRESCRQK